MNENQTNNPTIEPSNAGIPPSSPPPPSQQHYHAYPPQGKSSFFTGTCKITVLIGVAFTFLVLGVYYGGLISPLTSKSSGISKVLYRSGEGVETVAIVTVNGVITGDTAEYIERVVADIEKDENIQAIVLRIDSGGGGVTASDQIWQKFQKLKESRNLPIIASYGGLAASGGYYISAHADHIFAEPTTTTGSIGVIAQVFTMEDLMVNKLGVKPEIIPSTLATQKEVANNLFRSWNDADRNAIRKRIDPMHERFIDIVAKGRVKHLTRDQVLPLATGEVFSGQEAIEKKLVDEIGYLDDAIDKAILAGGFADKPPIIKYKVKEPLLGVLGVTQQATNPVSNINGQTIRTWLNELATPQMMYLYQPRN